MGMGIHNVTMQIHFLIFLLIIMIDFAGNKGVVNTETYTFDLTSPTSTIAAPLNGAVIMGSSYTIAGSSDDGNGAGV